jgi:hypothetical protein
VSSPDDKPVHIFENVTKGVNNAIELSLRHNSKAKVPIKIFAHTNAEFHINLNVPVMKEIEMFFTAHMKHNKIDISYYAELAKIQFLKYLNRGIDYVVSLFVLIFTRKQLILRRCKNST